MIGRYRDGAVPGGALDPALAQRLRRAGEDVSRAARPRRAHAGARARSGSACGGSTATSRSARRGSSRKDDAALGRPRRVLRSLAEGAARRSRCCCAPTCRRRPRGCSTALGASDTSLARARRSAAGSPAARSRELAPLFPKATVIDSHTHLTRASRPTTSWWRRRVRPGVDADPDRRDGRRRAAAQRAGRGRAVRRGVRGGRPPPQRDGRLRPTPTSTTLAAFARAIRAAWRSARRAWTTTATARRAPTRSARSRRRSSWPASCASRWSSTRARPRTTTIDTLARDATGLEVSCTASRCPTASTSASTTAGGSRSPATSPTRGAETSRRPRRACRRERLLVETDAPYLTPQVVPQGAQPAGLRRPHRASSSPSGAGSAYEELERAVDANAATLFGW